jgi:iron(III) transport system permease protein
MGGFYNSPDMLNTLARHVTGLSSLLLAVLALALALPVLAVLGSWLQWGGDSAGILREMVSTVLPDYTLTTLGLCLMVALGVTVVGVTTAALVTLFDFPGRGVFEWLLLLPLAMPAYVVAYAYTDFLQFSGPLQVALREALGLQGRLWPDVRSVWGAALVFTLSLYPYVYLLARTALVERASGLMEAARLLGAPLSRRIREIALPLARPAVAAGVALALMETLADFGVSSYFGIQTFTAGIYKAWLSMDNRIAAAQLATVLLLVVVVLLQLEQRAQKRMRFNQGRGSRQGSAEAQPVQLRGARRVLAWGLCSLPVLLGFVLPVLIMLRALVGETTEIPWERFGHWAWTSLRLGVVTAVLAVGVALALSFSVRTQVMCSAVGPWGWWAWVMPFRVRWWWWVCCCPWAGFSKSGPRLRLGPGSQPPRWAWSGLIWCAFVRSPCNPYKAAMRAFRTLWMIRPACWA